MQLLRDNLTVSNPSYILHQWSFISVISCLIVSCYTRSFGRQKIRPTKQMRAKATTRGDESDLQTPTHIHLKYTNGFHRPSHLIPPDTIHASPFSSSPAPCTFCMMISMSRVHGKTLRKAPNADTWGWEGGWWLAHRVLC